MGKDCLSRLHQHYSLWKSPNLNSSSAVPSVEQKKLFQPFTSSYTCMVSANGSLPAMEVSRLPQLKTFQGDGESQQINFQLFTKPHACLISATGSPTGLEVPGLSHSKKSQRIEEDKCFYYLPYHCESATLLTDTVLEEKLSTHKCGTEAASDVVPRSFQKQFLVFDHSGNRTNLILSSLIASPAQNLDLVNAPIDASGSQQKELETKRDLVAHPWPVIFDGLDKSKKSSEESEMHEDTEELDALLYSDDSDCDDEETSTAHSPSENTGMCQNQEEIEESSDEVTSPIGVAKRKRLADEEYDQSLLMDTTSSYNSLEYENDAESSCVNGRTQRRPYSSEAEANKRLKRERIWDTLNILQSIIPGEKGNDTALILDESIRYLRFLKHRAKCLGVAIE